MVACHNRLDVFKVFCLNIEHLRECYDINVTLCTSSFKVFDYGVKQGYLATFKPNNKPIGVKRNQAVEIARQVDSDLYFNIAEDHIINKHYIDRCLMLVKQGYAFIGTYDDYFHDYKKDISVYFPGYNGVRNGEVTGIGKVFTRELLDKMNWRMVEDKESVSLDYSNHNILKNIHHIPMKWYMFADDMLLDLKNGSTKNSIESMIKIGGVRIDNEIIFNKLPEIVVKAIKEL